MCVIFNRPFLDTVNVEFKAAGECFSQHVRLLTEALFVSLNSEKHFYVIPIMEAAVSSPFPPAEESSLLI